MSEFKTKARAIELLGRKQIRDSVTALAELMKNAYDADATWLRVEINTNVLPNHLIIADTGCGMSKEDIESKWLVLGTNAKTTSEKRSPVGHRPLMGAKGIGRLASAKLGKHLWMFSKTETGQWNIVFINWDIFENPFIAIEDISIPTRYGISTSELSLNIEKIARELVIEQMKNLNHESWELTVSDENSNKKLSELKNNITNALKIEEEIDFSKLKQYFPSIKNGTILYIDNLDDNWDDFLNAEPSSSRASKTNLENMHNRFASFVSSFKNTAPYQLPFLVEVYINSNLWDEDYAYTNDDYNYYDFKLDGTIENGCFKGQIFARNSDETLLEKCNEILKQGISVTAGIKDWEKVDCGKFSVKFCHLEEAGSSGLPKDDYDRISKKLDISCGLSVYRDGVRVLPYGEPENDFLNIEQRRTLKAGTYIFSYRNIFGSIDIDSENNPMLEDKSSREGLLENGQYYYFSQTLENLLKIIAQDFLGNSKKGSMKLRETYVEKNKATALAKKQHEVLEKEEKFNSAMIILSANNLMDKAQIVATSMSESVDALSLNWRNRVFELSSDDGYNLLRSTLDELKETVAKKAEEIGSFATQYHVEVPIRYEHYFSEMLLDQIAEHNRWIDGSRLKMADKLETLYSDLTKHLELQIKSWNEQVRVLIEHDPEIYKQMLLERLSELTQNSRRQLDSIQSFSRDNIEQLLKELAPIRMLLESVTNYSPDIALVEDWISITHSIEALSDISNNISDVFNNSPDKAASAGQKTTEKMEFSYQQIYSSAQKLKLKTGDNIGNFEKKVSLLTGAYNQGNSRFTDEEIIGQLRHDNVRLQAEMDIYSDLASLGLASEIVSHEFNQLFTNVNNAIRSMSPYIKDSNAQYWLRQIEVGFRSISDRQNQLSPMYRSYSLSKRNVNLHDFIDELCRFMSSALEHDGIQVINEISEDVTVTLSPSKVFPAVSNIINNAMYWVLDKKTRCIKLRYEESDKALFIEDSGPGISAIDKDRIFEPFVSYKPNGRGLGLTVARKVLESQGYELTIASEEEKTLSGACFKITFSDTEE